VIFLIAFLEPVPPSAKSAESVPSKIVISSLVFIDLYLIGNFAKDEVLNSSVLLP
jgi:hypothetical protein